LDLEIKKNAKVYVFQLWKYIAVVNFFADDIVLVAPSKQALKENFEKRFMNGLLKMK
jgi:hypothetical protein